jgi:cytochrome c5
LNKKLIGLAALLGFILFISAACRLVTGSVSAPSTATVAASLIQTNKSTETPAATFPPTASSIPAADTSTPAIDGKALLEDRCGVCHSLDYVYNSRGTADQWAAVVSIMISNGAVLDPQEEKILDGYLAKNFSQ